MKGSTVKDLDRTYIPLRQVRLRVVVGFVAVVTICLFFYRQLDYVANGQHRPPLLTFLEESIGGLAGLTVFPLVYLAAVHFPLLNPRWRRNLLFHLGCLCLISILHTTLIATFRAILLPLFGFGNVSYGLLPVRYPMEFAHLFIFYWAQVSLIYLFHEVRYRQARELRQAKLEATLAEAQLQNLRLQLEPHFLFNSLNAISAALYEDPRTADEMLGRLSELLRQLLKNDRSQEVPLSRELELLDLYIEMMRARLEDRLLVSLAIDPAARRALVPQLLLQPLVENAIRYGGDPVTFEVDIYICARLSGDVIEISVCDRGPGFADKEPESRGIGLVNTAERLSRLFGEAGTLRCHNGENCRGAAVDIRFPFKPAAAPAASEVIDQRERAVTRVSSRSPL